MSLLAILIALGILFVVVIGAAALGFALSGAAGVFKAKDPD